jgi:ribosomal protein S12 methylthiotransferase
VGRTIDVMVDEVDGESATGRSTWDAPEIDGSVSLEGGTGLKPGDIVHARVTRGDEYDVWAEIISSPRAPSGPSSRRRSA